MQIQIKESIQPEVPAQSRRIRLFVQILVLALVAVGIIQSVRKSSLQLETQRLQMSTRADELIREAEQASDAERRDQLTGEAIQLRRQAKDFWKADIQGLFLAGLLYGIGTFPAALFWNRCLTALDQHAPIWKVIHAYCYGNLGKYFPGKAMVIVIRLATLSPYGVKRIATTITIFLETLTMMAVGGGIAAISLIALNIDWRLTLLALGLLVTTFVPTFPPILRMLIPRLQKGVARSTIKSWTDRIHWGLVARGWLILALTWIAYSLSLLVVLNSLSISERLPGDELRLVLSCFGACSLAVVLGFVSLIPGGAGVREMVLLSVLTPVVGPVAALCSAIWLRIVWLVTELFLAGATGIVARTVGNVEHVSNAASITSDPASTSLPITSETPPPSSSQR